MKNTIRAEDTPTFTADTTRRTDLCFIAPGVSMNYTVQLIHTNGSIDTVEQLRYDPYSGVYITPMTVHIDHSSNSDDTVMLRVLGNMVGIPDADTMVRFTRETAFDPHPTFGDMTVAIATGGGFLLPPPDSCFAAKGPYSNPSDVGAHDVSVLVHYCGSGTITAQVYDYLGTPAGPPATYTADGQVWDRIAIPAPSTPGTYFLHVSVAGFSTTLSYSVVYVR